MTRVFHLPENISIKKGLQVLPPDIESITVDLDRSDVNPGDLLESPTSVKFFNLTLGGIPYLHLPRYTTFGIICDLGNQQDLAIRFFEKQLKQPSNSEHGHKDSTALCYLANVKMHKNKNYKEAELFLREAEENAPDNVTVRLSLMLFHMCQLQAECALTNSYKLRTLLTEEQFAKIIIRSFSEAILKFLNAVSPTTPIKVIDDKECSICTQDLSVQPNEVVAVKPLTNDSLQHYQPYHSCCLFNWLSTPGHDTDPNTNLPIDEIVRISKECPHS